MKRKRIDISEAYSGLFDSARYKVYWGGRGGGRSWSCARSLLIKAAHEKLFILCTREFQKSIKDSVYKLLCDQIKELGLDGEYEIQKDKIIGINTGSLFVFAGLKHNITNIKSMEGVDICWVEEGEKVSQNSWDILIPTIRKDESEIWTTFNPDLETDPTYIRFILNSPPDSIIIKTSWRDNNWFPDVLKKEKDYMFKVDPERAMWIWEGQCRSNSDIQIMKNKWVVDAFEPEKHWYGPYYGADWGFAVSPLALIRFWINPMMDTFDIMIEYEAWGVGVDLNDHPAFFDTVPGVRDHVIYADLARPETINLMIKAGFACEGAPKWPGCVEDGITWIRSCRKIVIHSRCKHVQDDARNYSYKTDKLTGDILPQIVKKWDDTWDALRYGATPFIVGDQDYGELVEYDDPVNISPI